MNHLRHLESTMKCSLIFLCRKLRTQNQNSSVQDQSDLESAEEVSGSWFSLTLTSVISSSFSEKWLNFIFTSCFSRLRSLDRRQETEGHITSTGVSTWRGSTPSIVKSELQALQMKVKQETWAESTRERSHLTGLTFFILEPGASREDNWVTDIFSVSKSNALKEVLSL